MQYGPSLAPDILQAISSLGPHLHIQVMDGPDPTAASVVPFRIRRYRQLAEDRSVMHLDAPLPGRATRVEFGA